MTIRRRSCFVLIGARRGEPIANTMIAVITPVIRHDRSGGVAGRSADHVLVVLRGVPVSSA